jgi:hypothetical protein
MNMVNSNADRGTAGPVGPAGAVAPEDFFRVVLCRLKELVADLCDEPVSAIGDDVVLLHGLLNSLTMIAFLARAEAEFAIEWRQHPSPVTLSSLRAIAEAVVELRSNKILANSDR